MDINSLTSEELYKLAKKKSLSEMANKRPNVLLESNSSENNKIISLAENYMAEEEAHYEIETQWAYELLMQLVYGEDVFDYINALEEK